MKAKLALTLFKFRKLIVPAIVVVAAVVAWRYFG